MATSLSRSSLLSTMRKHAAMAIRDADLVFFVIDSQMGVTPLDISLSKQLRGLDPDCPEWAGEKSPLFRRVKSSQTSPVSHFPIQDPNYGRDPSQDENKVPVVLIAK